MKAQGIVIKIYADDVKGAKHQRFIVRLKNKQTVLVIHNIDIAPKLFDLKLGDKIEFLGQYQWNNRGGLVHWTHHDPHGVHPLGWLKHNGKVYS